MKYIYSIIIIFCLFCSANAGVILRRNPRVLQRLDMVIDVYPYIDYNSTTYKIVFSTDVDMDGYSLEVSTISSDNALSFMPSGDTDDYLQFLTTSDRPTLKVIGGNTLYLESDGALALLSMRYDANHAFSIGQSATQGQIYCLDGFAFVTNNDYDDYFFFQTSGDIPEITTVGDCNLKLSASSGLIDINSNIDMTDYQITASTVVFSSATITMLGINTAPDSANGINIEMSGGGKWGMKYTNSAISGLLTKGGGIYNDIIITDTSASAYGMKNVIIGSGTIVGMYNDFAISSTGGSVYGVYNDIIVGGSTSLGEGIYNAIETTADASIQRAMGVKSFIGTYSGSLDIGYGFVYETKCASTGGDQYGFFADADYIPPVLDNFYAFYAKGDNLTVNTAKWGVYIEDLQSYFGDNVISESSATFSCFVSTVATGTQPYACTSQTLNTNLNADLLDSQEGSYYLALANATGTLDISDQSNLAVTSPIVLTDDTLSFDFSVANIWTADQTFNDNVEIKFGTGGGEGSIYSDGSQIVISDNAKFLTDAKLYFRDAGASLHSPSSQVLRYTVTGLGARHEWYTGANELMRIGSGIRLGGASNYVGVTLGGNMTFVGTSGFYPRRITQADIPEAGTGATQIDTAEMIFWEDSDDDSVHLVYNDTTAGIKSVLLE